MFLFGEFLQLFQNELFFSFEAFSFTLELHVCSKGLALVPFVKEVVLETLGLNDHNPSLVEKGSNGSTMTRLPAGIGKNDATIHSRLGLVRGVVGLI